MKQKIVIKVAMRCNKCRRQALEIAVAAAGVTSVGFQGDDNERLVIEGDGVDAACLTKSLRKKLCHAILETVEQIKPKPPPEKKPEPETKIVCCSQPQCEVLTMVPVSDPCTTGGCTIV